MGKYSEIPCEEIFSTSTEGLTLDSGMSASVALLVDYDKRWDLVDDIMTTPRFWPNGKEGWVAPAPTNASITPEPTEYTTDIDGQVIEYLKARVTIQYALTGEDSGGGGGGEEPGDRTLLVESYEPSTQFVTLDPKKYFWAGEDGTGNKKSRLITEQARPGVIIRGGVLVRKTFNIASIPQSVLTLGGCSNDADYNSTLLGLTFPLGTLLFVPPTMDRTFTMEGTEGWNLTSKYMYRENDWNTFYNQDTELWEFVKTIKGRNISYHYPRADFSNWLF